MPILLVEPFGPALESVREKLGKDESLQVIEAGSPFEATSLVKRVGTCIVLMSAPDQQEVVKQISMLKLIREPISTKKAIVIVATPIRHREIQQKFAQYGCSEVIQEPIAAKSLLFKIDRYVKLHKKSIQAAEGSNSHERYLSSASRQSDPQDGAEQPSPLELKLAERVKRTKAFAAAQSVVAAKSEAVRETRVVPPLELQSDCWIARTDGDSLPPGVAKRIADRWVVRISGPGPLAGRWNELEVEDEQDRCWQWVPNDPENDAFVVEQGSWVFKGHRPDFVDEVWTFVGKRPELSFYYEGECYGTKFKLESGQLVMAEDSKQALERSLALIATIHKVIRKEEKGRETEFADEPVKMKREGSNGAAAKAFHDEEDQVVRKSRDHVTAAPSEESRVARFAEKTSEAAASGKSVHVVDPIGLESDCWLIDTRSCRHAVGRWIVKAKGPTGAHGRWAPAQGQSPDESGEQYWEWTPKDPENDPFIREQGAWYFYGLKPELSDGVWTFQGRRATLAFFYESESFGEKLATSEEGDTLLVAADSVAAQRSLGFDIEDFRVKEAADSTGSAFHYEEERAAGRGSDLRTSGFDEGDRVPVQDHREGRGGREIEVGNYVDEAQVPSAGAANFIDEAQVPGAGAANFVDEAQVPSAGAADFIDQARSERGGNDYIDEDSGSAALGVMGSRRGNAFADSIRARLQDAGIDLSEKTNQALAQFDETVLAAGGRPPYRGESDLYKANSGAQGPDAIRAERPPGPTLRPLTIAFLMSELLANREMKRTWIAHRFCAYLGSSCGGLRVELWAAHRGKWFCTGTSDESKGRCGAELAEAREGAQMGTSGRALVAGVAEAPGAETLVGALVIAGEGVESVLPQYAEAVAQMARGLLRSMSADPGLDEGLVA